MNTTGNTQRRTLAVRLDGREIANNLQKMTDVLRNVAINNKEALIAQFKLEGEDAENTENLMPEDSVKALLQDAVNHHVEHYVFQTEHRQNSSIETVLEEDFAALIPFIQNDTTSMNYLRGLYTRTCAQVAEAVLPAAMDLHRHDNGIEKIETYHPFNTCDSFYIVTGEPYSDEVVDEDKPEVTLPRVQFTGVRDSSTASPLQSADWASENFNMLSEIEETWDALRESLIVNPIEHVSLIASAPTHHSLDNLEAASGIYPIVGKS